jgi:CheY-like chemotaxis protein
MPAASLPVGKIRVLIMDSREESASALADALKANYDVQTVRSNFEAGFTIQRFAPHVLLVNLLAKGIDATGICTSIRADEDLQTIKIIALANHLSSSESAALLTLPRLAEGSRRQLLSYISELRFALDRKGKSPSEGSRKAGSERRAFFLDMTDAH